jgi:hypothetical protein
VSGDWVGAARFHPLAPVIFVEIIVVAASERLTGRVRAIPGRRWVLAHIAALCAVFAWRMFWPPT